MTGANQPAGRLTPEREIACTLEFISKPRKLTEAGLDALVFFLEDRGLLTIPPISFVN